MTDGPHPLLGDGLLAALQAADQGLLSPHAERALLEKGEVLFEPGEDVKRIHFPCAATIVSLVVPMEDDHVVEVAMIGREGAVGGVISEGFVPAFTRAVVQNPGPCVRIPMAAIQAAKRDSPILRNLFTRYADCLLSQVLQSVACNALHTIDQRCAKWLLTTRDRVGDRPIQITHESLAEMLGVQRSYVSKVMGRLSRGRAVRAHRGSLEIIDPAALEEISCECYGRLAQQFTHVLTGIYPESDRASEAERGRRNQAALTRR